MDIQRIISGVEALALHPQRNKVFGAYGHGFDFEDPLSQEELDAAEAQFRVELPQEYRSFLLQVGAGGAGPHYGIFPLLESQGQWRWEGDGAEMTSGCACRALAAHGSVEYGGLRHLG